MQGADALPPTPWPLPAPGEAAAPPELTLLDERDEWLAFSHAWAHPGAVDAPGMWESMVAFQGMHCAACAVTLEQLIARVPGVVRVDVSAAAQRGRIVWDEARTRPSRWMQALAR